MSMTVKDRSVQGLRNERLSYTTWRIDISMNRPSGDSLLNLLPPFTREALEELYGRWNRRRFVHPDPLEFLYGFSRSSDREIVGLIASCLAYGRVSQILGSVSKVLDVLGPSPSEFVLGKDLREFRELLAGFRHRFTTGDDLSKLLVGIRKALDRYGSLEDVFLDALEHTDGNFCSALTIFARRLKRSPEGNVPVPSPEKGSACKRLNLFLRWMVRCDEVDPGGWFRIQPSRLMVPLDTHMHRIALRMGLTRRLQADWRTAREVTEAFASLVPEDPVRYDFVLTRLGIWASNGMDKMGDVGEDLRESAASDRA